MDVERRNLMLAAAGLLVLLFSGRAVISSVYDDATVRARVAGMSRQLRSGGEADRRPRPADAAAAKGLRAGLQDRLDDLVPRLHYTQPVAFDVGPSDSPDLRYIEILRREQALLVDRAHFAGRAVPSNLGMPDLNPTGLEDVRKALRSLHVVHLVVGSALEAGVDAVEEIQTPQLRGRRRPVTGFLRAQRVEFRMRGTPRAVRDALEGVAAGTPYLALDDVRVEHLDEEGEQVSCRFGAAVLQVDVGRELSPAGRRP